MLVDACFVFVVPVLAVVVSGVVNSELQVLYFRSLLLPFLLLFIKIPLPPLLSLMFLFQSLCQRLFYVHLIIQASIGEPSLISPGVKFLLVFFSSELLVCPSTSVEGCGGFLGELE